MFSTTKKDFSVTEVFFFVSFNQNNNNNYEELWLKRFIIIVICCCFSCPFLCPPLSIQSWTFQVMTANKFYSLSNTTFLCLRTYTHTVMTKAFNFLLCLLGAFNTFGILVVMEREKTTIVVCLVDDKSKHEN